MALERVHVAAFIGIALAIAAAIAWVIVRARRAAPRMATANGRVFLQEKSAEEIMNALKDVKPLDRPSVISSTYKGRWVKWTADVLDVKRDGHGYHLLVEQGSRYVVGIDLSTEELPRLEALKKGDTVTFESEVESVGGGIVWTRNGRIFRFGLMSSTAGGGNTA